MDLPAGFAAGFAERLQELLPVVVIPEDGIAAVSPVHHVINCARIFHPQLACHFLTVFRWTKYVNIRNRPLRRVGIR
jgi:hypothetical protein